MRSILTNYSVWGIIIGNAFTLFMALNQHWSMMPLIWIYFGQNIIIGITNYFRMRAIEGKNKPMSQAGFFIQHYGFFHALYLMFLLIFTFAPEEGFAPGIYEKVAMTDSDALWIWLCIGSFAIVPLYNLIRYRGRDFGDNPPSVDTLFMYPYLRVVPMHLTIIFAFVMDNALIYFMLIKTIADLGMEMVEYRMFRHGAEKLEMKD